MSYHSQPGFVGFKRQTVKGTYKDPGAVAPNQGVFVRTRSGSLGGNRDLLIPDPEIGGNRDIPDAQLGPIAYTGEYNMYLRAESAAFFLCATLGTVVDSGAVATGYSHVITPANACDWVSVEEQIADQYLNFKYTDGKINTFHLEADANGYLMGTASLVALTQAIDSSPTTDPNKRWDTSGLLVGTEILVKWNSVTLPAKSFTMDINNNMETDDFRLGSLFLGDAAEKRREVTLGVTIRPQDAALWKTAMWGGPAATVPGGVTLKQAARVTITSYEMIPGSTGPPVPYSIDINIPSAVIAPFNLSPSGDDVLQHDLEIRALRPDPAVALLTATVVNSYALTP